MKRYDLTPDVMWSEIMDFEQKAERMFRAHQSMIDRYTGTLYNGRGYGMYGAENHAYEWFATVSAQILASNPWWLIKARRADKGRENAISIKDSLNRWTRDTNLKATLEKLFVDWGFRRCAALIRRENMPAMDRGPMNGPWKKPAVDRLNLRRLGYSADATDWLDTRRRWHKSIFDLDGMIDEAKEEDGWHTDLMATLQVNQNLDSVRGDRHKGVDSPYGYEGQTYADRRDIVVYEVWCPENQLDGRKEEDGYHGSWHTFAYTSPEEGSRSRTLEDRQKDGDGSIVEIREAQPFFGPSTGPYIMGGQDYVPDEVEPLAQFIAIEQQLRSLNVRSAVMQQSMEDYKRLFIINAKDSSLPGKIHSAKHRSVIPAKGFKKEDIFAGEIGGLTDQMVKQFALEKDRIDRLSGLTDAMRGNVTGQATATENAIAQGGATARLAKLRNSWYAFTEQIGQSVAWYMFMDDQYVVELSPEAMQQLNAGKPPDQQMTKPWLQGGRQPGESFEDLEITIQPMSMEYVNEQKLEARAMGKLQVYMQLATIMAQAPFMNWKDILGDVGDDLGEPAMPERVNYQMLEQFAGLMLHMQLAGAAQTGSAAQSKPQQGKDNPKVRNAQATVTPTQGPKKSGSPGQSAGNSALKPAKSYAGMQK